jgi:putative transposase
MSKSGDVSDNSAMETLFSSLKTDRMSRKVYRTRDEAKTDAFDYVERFYNPYRRHSTIGYVTLLNSSREPQVGSSRIPPWQCLG